MPERNRRRPQVAAALIFLSMLSAGARVHDAVDRAGGPSTDADLDGLNLAAALADGQRLYVPAIGDVPGDEATAAEDAGEDEEGRDGAGEQCGRPCHR